MKNTPITVIGLMSGTSLDGIDVAIIKTNGEKIYEFGDFITVNYDEKLKEKIKFAINGNAKDIPYIENELTIAHAEAVKKLIKKSGEKPDLIGFHGQTIYHNPAKQITWQLGNGALLAELCNIPIVCDFRKNDVVKGGQGAPLVPIFHKALGVEKPAVIVNIGGISNITFIGEDDELIAFDTGAGNTLIDRWVKKYSGKDFDKDGELAEKGEVNNEVLNEYLSDEYYKKSYPKSLDSSYFSIDKAKGLSLEDGAVTFAYLTAKTIADSIKSLPQTTNIFIAGGGRLNAVIMQMLSSELNGFSVMEIEHLGINGDALEAYAFGFLAVRSLYGLPLTYPDTTGVKEPTKGGLYVK